MPQLISAHCFTAQLSLYIVSGVWACLGTNTCTLTPGPRAQTQLMINTWPTLPPPGLAKWPPFPPSLFRPVKAPRLPLELSAPLPFLCSLHNGLWNNNAMFSRKLIRVKNVLPTNSHNTIICRAKYQQKLMNSYCNWTNYYFAAIKQLSNNNWEDGSNQQ